MAELTEMLHQTELRLYTEGIKGVEVHSGGRAIATFKTKPLARAFVEGAWWQMTQRGGDRTSPAAKGVPESTS